ncbi:MAG: hypothetical protein Q4C70_13290 [Planctomycetia bacterium]|nr:hypothetical protein [Planctomycetia bacterium]
MLPVSFITNFMANSVENPTFSLILLGFTLVFVLAGYLISHAKMWLVPILPILLMAGGLILADYLIFSPKERVMTVIQECIVAVERNQKAELMTHVAPELKSDVEQKINWAFSLAEFEHAYANDVKLTENEFTTPPTIRATFFAGVRFKVRSGMAYTDRYACIMTLDFEEFRPGEWLITAHEERNVLGNGTP